MDDADDDRAAFATAERLLGAPLVLPLGPGEPPSGADFRRLATRHTFYQVALEVFAETAGPE